MNNKGALNLLSLYGEDDSSDDETPSARVSVKRTFKESEDSTTREYKIAKRKLPVPNIFTQKDGPKVTEEMHVDDPSLHDGRVRSFPHERGNWSTYVYIPYEVSEGVEALTQLLISSLPQGELKPVDHYHISVTKTVILRHHWIEEFTNSIRNKLSPINSFPISFGQLNVYCNEERTRSFIGLQVKIGYEQLCGVIKKMDECLSEFKLPPFYKDPSFHVSICWCIGDYEAELKSLLQEINQEVLEIMHNHSEDNNWSFTATKLECKTGNKLFTFHLT